MKPSEVINNYLAGNLSGARAQAMKFFWESLFDCCRDEFGMSEAESRKACDYLKRKEVFQDQPPPQAPQ